MSSTIHSGSEVVTPPDGPSESRGPERLRGLLGSAWQTVPKHQAGLVVVLLASMIIAANASPYFLTTQNAMNVLQSQALVGMMAVAVTLVMLSGSVDISMGGVVALSGVVAGLSMQAGTGSLVACVFGVLAGLGAGAINATLVVWVGINPIVATLGTQFLFRGLAYLVNNGESVDIGPGVVTDLGKHTVGIVPLSVISFAVLAALLLGLSRYTRWGRHLYATGGSESAARRAGVRTRRVSTVAFLISGAVSGFCGVLLAGQTGVAFPSAASGIEFLILASIIVGGTNLLGVARGGVGGTILGVLLFGVIFNAFNLTSINVFVQPIVEGIVLIAAVTVDEVRRKKGRAL